MLLAVFKSAVSVEWKGWYVDWTEFNQREMWGANLAMYNLSDTWPKVLRLEIGLHLADSPSSNPNIFLSEVWSEQL